MDSLLARGGELAKLEDRSDADGPIWISASLYTSELEAGAAYPSGTAPILFWMSTMEADVMGMDRNTRLRTNQR